MAYVISFYGYEPNARYDGQPWTTVKIEESTSKTGPWTLIDTKTLSPVDTDPTNPVPRSFTTNAGTLMSGWYRISFVDGAANVEYTDPVYHGIAPTTLATVGDVKRLMRLGNITAEQEAQMQEALEAVDSFLRPYLQDFGDASGTVIEHHVAPGSPIDLPVNGAAVAAVRTYLTPGASAITLTSALYQVSNTHLLLEPLKLSTEIWPYTYGADFTNGVPGDITLARVEFDWTAVADIPKAVRDGVALTAAVHWRQSQSYASGILSERIGDYSYTISRNGGGRTNAFDQFVPASARALLRPFRRRLPVFTT